LNSLKSSTSKRPYDHAIRDFTEWYCSETRIAFNRTVVTRYRIALEQRPYAPSTIQELSGRLHFLSVGRYAVKVSPLLVDNIRFRLVNKPGCQHEKIDASVPSTTMIGV
jgi:hypothetical protein